MEIARVWLAAAWKIPHPKSMETARLGYAFEHLVARIFLSLGFVVKEEATIEGPPGTKHAVADLALEQNGVRSVVEIKFYRSRTPSPGDLVRAGQVLAMARDATGADHALLVVNLKRKLLPEFDPELDITIIGLDELIAMVDGDANLLDELVSMTRELNSGLGDFERPTNLSPASPVADILEFMGPSSGRVRPPPTPPRPAIGRALANELREITPGGRSLQQLSSERPAAVSWRLFEDVALESLQYVFGDEMGAWKTQERVAGDDKRFDALAKVRGDDVFCRTLIEDFRSRYVLFEFKNYSGPLTPNPLYVTEKYLFPTALRGTAIIISPSGFTDKAAETARGALRDAGKLILDVKVDTLCQMLESKDRGDGASLRMETLLDEFLQTLGR